MTDVGTEAGQLPKTDAHASGDLVDRLGAKLDTMLDKLGEAKPFAKSTYQTDVFQTSELMLSSDNGIRALYERAHRFDDVGLFASGAWADAAKLQPPLVEGSLKAHGVYPIVEILSDLRMLAIASGKQNHPEVSAADATNFLQEVMALNLQFVFPGDTEQERIEGGPHYESSLRLFRLLSDELGLSFIREYVVAEIRQIIAQRPIMTGRVRTMIRMAARTPDSNGDDTISGRLSELTEAIDGPSTLCKQATTLAEYRKLLQQCEKSTLRDEAEQFATTVSKTGLVAPQHAILLRYLATKEPDIIPEALSLDDYGAAEFEGQIEFARQLVKAAIFPTTAQCILGFARVLERGLLSRQEVSVGLERLVDLDLQPDIRRSLLAQRSRHDGVTANSILLAGALSVLGQPLGVGQGRNPTCQAARGISLWSQYAPAYLIELVVSAARDGVVEIPFEGQTVRSDKAVVEMGRSLDLNLDPVSVVLVPHLDRIYEQMMKLVALRNEDGHKWVNPALYGRWVARGFSSVFADVALTTISGYEDFVRRFFATHHPSFNEGHSLMYPNPVGLCITNGHGDYLGPHAVSLQRVSEGPDGKLRIYFFNPNNEGRQDWGHDVKPSIADNGELEGESSLPFNQFVSRLYAFHYNPYEVGDAYAVPDAVVNEIQKEASDTWGRAFQWM